MIEDLRADVEEVLALKKAMQLQDDALASAEQRAEWAENKLEKGYSELAFLTNTLLSAEAKVERGGNMLNWLIEVTRFFMSSKPWWWTLMPKRWRRERELRHLARLGLFDAQAYAEKYPDVKDAGLDPLHHYIFHGLQEMFADRR